METYNETRNDSLFPEFGYIEHEEDVIFDRTYVRIIFILLYTVVFCLCFFGNLLVILVVTLSRRLRSITNFFLANLAVADLCVGVFCVYQNLMIYITEWSLGNFLCKMYQFTNSFSYTSSILILVVICTERYFAIIYPITCKQILTSRRLRLAIAVVWITSALYSAPKFFWVTTVTNFVGDKKETICIQNRQKYNSEIFDMINFAVLYVVPLAVMLLLYTRIAICLWRSSRQLEKQLNASTNCADQYQYLCRRKSSRYKHRNVENKTHGDGGLLQTENGMSNRTSSQNVLRARRGVIRMLIVVVCTFALCNLPLHARKMWQYWSRDYRGNSNFSAVLTPLTFLITYINSAVNPLLYAFLSRNFRRGIKELFLCAFGRKRFQAESNYNAHDLKMLQRYASTRSTLKANATTVTILNNEHSSDGSNEL